MKKRIEILGNRILQNRNFVHPPNPPLILLVCGLLMVLSCHSAKGQLLEYEQYKRHCKAYWNKVWTAERSEFIDIQKGKNWNLVPSVGLVFGLPSVNLNTGQIANYKERQAITKAKLKSIDLKYETIYNEELMKIKIGIAKAKELVEKYKIANRLLIIQKKIYNIHKEAFDKKEMKPLDFYATELTYQREEIAVDDLLREFKLEILEVEKLSHFSYDEKESLAYDGNDDCIMLSPEFSER